MVAADHETEMPRVAAINAAIDETRATGQVSTPSRRKLIWRIAMLLVTAFSLYLLFPAIISVLGSWKDLETVNPLWFPLIIATQVASLACFWNLQRIALRTKAWFSVATSQLASGSLTRIVPGGQAAGAAMQFRMLTVAGINAATAGTSITALSLLTTGTVFVLPVLVLPAILSGTRVPSGLAQAAWIGAGGFVLLAIGAGCLLIFDRPLEIMGSVIQRIRNRVERKKEPVTDLPDRLVKERDLIRSALGAHLGAAILERDGALPVRLPHPSRSAHRGGSPSRPRARAAGVCRSTDPRNDPDHSRWARLRRSGAHRHVGSRRRRGGRSRARDADLSPRFVLVAAVRRLRCVSALPSSLSNRERCPARPGHVIEAFLISFGIIFVAEMGDKSQLMALGFATRYPAVPVLVGITLATATVHLASVFLGAAVGAALPERAIEAASGVAFLVFAWWTLRGDTLGDDDEARLTQSHGSVVLTVGGLFLLSELGDKTMLATVTLATEYGLLGVWLGSTLGMVAADALAIVVGRLAGDRLPERAIRIGAAVVFAIIGTISLVDAAIG